MQASGDSTTGVSVENVEGKVASQKKIVEQLKEQWKLLWSERFNDKVLAEAVSAQDYESLRVQRGTIVYATRDFKPLNFKEILSAHKVENPDRYVLPNNHLGGWSKFIKTQITQKNPPQTRRAMPEIVNGKKGANQPKKGGRGWLHAYQA